ncbi:MAG: acyltransferase [Bacteroidetes bacterium]|nr:MAG: acyltransferase [Bacteroidota bacterium]
MAKQNNSVQTLRGLAIILVVMGHVIGYKGDEGMKVADDSFWRYLYYSLEYFRMPLFTVISGWVYTLRPLTKETFVKFLNGKARRLLVPLMAVGLLYFITRLITPGTNREVHISEIWQIFVFKYDLYWYLPSLFWVFVVISFIEYRALMKTITGWTVVLIISILMLTIRNIYLTETPNYFGIIGMFYLIPFFIIGIGIGRFHSLMSNKIFVSIMTFLFILGIIIQQLTWFNVIELPFHGKSSPLGLLVGMTGTIVLFRVRLINRWLVYIGGFSYAIYLFHVFGTASSRIVLLKLGFDNQIVIFLVSLTIGIIVPIIIELIIDKFKLTRFLFLGRQYSLPRNDNTKK